jgi:hypothetical protein
MTRFVKSHGCQPVPLSSQTLVTLPVMMCVVLQREFGQRTVLTPSVSYITFTRMPQLHCQETMANMSSFRWGYVETRRVRMFVLHQDKEEFHLLFQGGFKHFRWLFRDIRLPPMYPSDQILPPYMGNCLHVFLDGNAIHPINH